MVVSLMEHIRALFARFEVDGEYTSRKLLQGVERAVREDGERVTIERKVEFDAGFERMRIAAYRVKDPETGERSNLQFHFTHGPTVLAVLGENAAKLFANFIFDTLGDQKCISEIAAAAKSENTIRPGLKAEIEDKIGPLESTRTGASAEHPDYVTYMNETMPMRKSDEGGGP